VNHNPEKQIPFGNDSKKGKGGFVLRANLAQVSEARPGAPASVSQKQIPCGNDSQKGKNKSGFSSGMTRRETKAEGDFEERGLQIHFRETRLRSPGERTATSKTTQNY
jgi:hypothetical protein